MVFARHLMRREELLQRALLRARPLAAEIQLSERRVSVLPQCRPSIKPHFIGINFERRASRAGVEKKNVASLPPSEVAASDCWRGLEGARGGRVDGGGGDLLPNEQSSVLRTVRVTEQRIAGCINSLVWLLWLLWVLPPPWTMTTNQRLS